MAPALYSADQGLITVIWSPPGMIPESTVKNKLLEQVGMVQKQKKGNFYPIIIQFVML